MVVAALGPPVAGEEREEEEAVMAQLTLAGVSFVSLDTLMRELGLSGRVLLRIADKEGIIKKKVGRKWFLRKDQFDKWAASGNGETNDLVGSIRRD